MKTWIKGGLIGAGIGLVLLLIIIFAGLSGMYGSNNSSHWVSDKCTGNLCYARENPSFGMGFLLLNPITGLIIGVILGLSIKNKKRKKKK